MIFADIQNFQSENKNLQNVKHHTSSRILKMGQVCEKSDWIGI